MIVLEFLYQKGCSVDNYHDPCLHPSFQSTGLLNRQIKPAGSGRWNKVSAWISNFIRGKKRHVDIKRKGWIFMLTPLTWLNLQEDQLRASPSLAARPFTCNAVLGSCSWVLEANPSSLSLLHKALLHLRRTAPLPAADVPLLPQHCGVWFLMAFSKTIGLSSGISLSMGGRASCR